MREGVADVAERLLVGVLAVDEHEVDSAPREQPRSTVREEIVARLLDQEAERVRQIAPRRAQPCLQVDQKYRIDADLPWDSHLEEGQPLLYSDLEVRPRPISARQQPQDLDAVHRREHTWRRAQDRTAISDFSSPNERS